MSQDYRAGRPGLRIETGTSGTIPESFTAVGTMEAAVDSNILYVTGVQPGEIREGDFIYREDVLRRVVRIVITWTEAGNPSDGVIEIESPFPTTPIAAGQPIEVVRTRYYVYVKIANTGAGSATIGQGTLDTLASDSEVEYRRENGLEPIAFVATASTLQITTLR